MSDRDPRLFPHTGPLYGGPVYPGNGYPPNRGEDRPGLSPFGRLAKGQALGESCVLIYDADKNGLQHAQVDMIGMEGDDADAQQLIITLTPPRVIPIAFADINLEKNSQALTGEQLNSEVADGNFPGDTAPITWPPLEVYVKWGVRGAESQAVVDYVNGVTFSVTASALHVRAQVSQGEQPGGIVGTSAAYRLAAFVGPGFARGNAHRTVYVGTVGDDDESGVFDIPRFARRAYVIGNDAGATPVSTTAILRFWQSPDGLLGGNNVGNFTEDGTGRGFDIPAGAAYFSLINTADIGMRMSVMFELALS